MEEVKNYSFGSFYLPIEVLHLVLSYTFRKMILFYWSSVYLKICAKEQENISIDLDIMEERSLFKATLTNSLCLTMDKLENLSTET